MYCRYIIVRRNILQIYHSSTEYTADIPLHSSSEKIQEVQGGWLVSSYGLLQFWVRIFTNTWYRFSYLALQSDGYPVCVTTADHITLQSRTWESHTCWPEHFNGKKNTTMETRIYREGKTLWLNGGINSLIPNFETECLHAPTSCAHW